MYAIRSYYGGRNDLDERAGDRFGPLCFEQGGEASGLLGGSRHQDAPAEQGPLVEPAQLLAQRDHLADDDDRRLV